LQSFNLNPTQEILEDNNFEYFKDNNFNLQNWFKFTIIRENNFILLTMNSFKISMFYYTEESFINQINKIRFVKNMD